MTNLPDAQGPDFDSGPSMHTGRAIRRPVGTAELQRRLAAAVTAGIKPPLGVIPRRIHEDRRLAELDRAITEYSAFELPVDPAWERERDDLLAHRAQATLTAGLLVRARRAGKAAEQYEAISSSIDQLVHQALERGCGVLLVGSPAIGGTGALLGYVDDRIPVGQLVEHPGPLPQGGVEELLAGLYPPAGPKAGHPPSPSCSPRSCGEFSGDDLRSLPAGTEVGYGKGIVARKRDDGDWTVFEDDRPGLRVSSLMPSRVTGIVKEAGPRQQCGRCGTHRPFAGVVGPCFEGADHQWGGDDA